MSTVETSEPPAADLLPAALLEAIAPRGSARTFAANAILINEGDTTDSLYIVLSGRVKVYASSDDGREVVLTEYGPGEYFGELSIDGARRSASIKALEACSCRSCRARSSASSSPSTRTLRCT